MLGYTLAIEETYFSARLLSWRKISRFQKQKTFHVTGSRIVRGHHSITRGSGYFYNKYFQTKFLWNITVFVFIIYMWGTIT